MYDELHFTIFCYYLMLFLARFYYSSLLKLLLALFDANWVWGLRVLIIKKLTTLLSALLRRKKRKVKESKDQVSRKNLRELVDNLQIQQQLFIYNNTYVSMYLIISVWMNEWIKWQKRQKKKIGEIQVKQK